MGMRVRPSPTVRTTELSSSMLVMNRTAGVRRPAVRRLAIIEPVLLQHGTHGGLHLFLEPGTQPVDAFCLSRGEEVVADHEVLPEGRFVGDAPVEGADPADQGVGERIGLRVVGPGQEPLLPGGVEGRTEGDEGEAASQGQVDYGQGAIGDVHRADGVEVAGQPDPLGLHARGLVGEVDGVLRRPLAALDQSQHLAEGAGGMASVDLLDDHGVAAARVGVCGVREAEEGSVDELQARGAVVRDPRSVAADEVLVRCVRMKLHNLDRLRGSAPGQDPAEALGEPGLSGARCPLEDEILGPAQQAQDPLEILAGDEAALGQKVVDGVGAPDLDRRVFGRFAGDLGLRLRVRRVARAGPGAD